MEHNQKLIDIGGECTCEDCCHELDLQIRENTKQMVAIYNSGVTLTEIGKRHGYSRVIVRNRFLMHGYVKNKQGKYVLNQS